MIELEPIQKLSRDLANASKTLSHNEARYLVDMYYKMQEHHTTSSKQAIQLEKSDAPHDVIDWVGGQSGALENQIKRALDKYTDEEPAGVWAKSNVGIGPVLSAGLCASIGDAARFQTCGDFWSYCGLAPGQKRKRGEKSNWSRSLKRLAWLIGQSFVKVSGNENSLYGRLYKEKKEYYIKKNEAGDYKERAEQCLTEKKYGKDTEAYRHYSSGRLPPAHIQAMAERYAAKIFLSHFWEVSLRIKGIEPPKAYAIAILGHAHEIKPRDT